MLIITAQSPIIGIAAGFVVTLLITIIIPALRG